MTHEECMRRAIALAKKGAGWTAPNPMVGAVIVKDGRIIAEGYHHKYGELHAERDALSRLTESAEGSTMYVTLEPCCHHGKQPPCTEAVIAQGIRTVYIGSRDPNPLVSGKGVQILREHGISVIEDFLREECDEINRVFFHYITTRTPYVVMKYAMTLDGKIATHTGASKWITGEIARAHVQTLRGRYASILAGIGTVLADDPMLNCRLEGAHQPLRIVMDSSLRIPVISKLVQSAKEYPTLIVCAVDLSEEGYQQTASRLQAQGVQIVSLPDTAEPNKVSVTKLLTYLGEMQIDSILVEGGGEIHDAFRATGSIRQVDCYIAPKIFGGAKAKTPVSGAGIAEVSEALLLSDYQIRQLGNDLLLEGWV